jgi:hypothetical protein
MLYKRRELRRLWRVHVYQGDHNAEDAKTVESTVVAWNQTDATRAAGGEIAELPEPLHFVTHPDADDNVYRIDDPNVGPIGDPITPSIVRADPSEEEWK